MNAERRTLNCDAIRQLHDLALMLRKQLDALYAFECTDIDAADATLFAIDQVEKALANARSAQKRVLHPER